MENYLENLRVYMRKRSKTLKIMKLSLLLMILGIMQVSASVYSQNNKISIQVTEVELKDLIWELKESSELVFIYKSSDLKGLDKVSLETKDASISEILDQVLKGKNLVYSLDDNVVIIKKKTDVESKPTKGDEQEQKGKRIIKGKIVDEKGFPLPGVTIRIDKTTIGTSTDNEGLFKINVTAPEGKIVVSFIGMKSQTITYKSGKLLNIVLVSKEESLSEVVVTGYANINKESFTGNPITISQDEILKVSKTNIVQALQTFDPSFRIMENNVMGSDPNALPEMYIRGRSGIGVKELDKNDFNRASLENNPNLPTFIMDGFEVSVEKVYDMDPTRIKGITILKDAAATAMYGSRAANGVVVITTVPPKAGELRVTYNLTGTLSVPDLTDYNLMEARELLETERLAGFYEGDNYFTTVKLLDEYDAKLKNVNSGVNTYWLSKPLETVLNTKHSLYIEGGKENIRFGVNLTSNNEDGVMKGSFRDRKGAGFHIDYRYKDFQVKNSIYYSAKKSQESPYGDFSDYSSALPYDVYKDENGNYLTELEGWHNASNNSRMNPLYESTLNNFDRNNYEELINNLSLNWSVNSYLRLKGQFSVTKKYSESERFLDPLSAQNSDVISTGNMSSGELFTTDGKGVRWNANALMSYNRLIEKHNINFTLGLNAVSNQTKSISAHYKGFPSGTLHSPNFAQEIYEKPSTTERASKLIGFLSSLNYTYDNIYLFDLSCRFDGSSEFGSNNKFAPFWACGFGINFHNYKFLKGNDVISHLKLRSSYGSSGKVNFPSYVTKTTYEVLTDEWYRTGYGTSLKALGNEDLTWEKTNTLDIGFELGLFDKKIFFEGSYYNKKTVDLITTVSVPGSSGFKSYYDNLGEVENVGYELSCRADIIKTNDINLAIFANLSHNENRILKISKSLKAYNDKVNDYYVENNIFRSESTRAFTKYEEGRSLTAVYGMRSLGIDPSNGNEIFQKKDGTITSIWNINDQVVIGDTEPDLRGAFGVNMRYKNFSLYTSFLYQFGGQSYNYTLVSKVENANIYETNVDKRVFDSRWKQAGDKVKYKSISDDKRYTRPTSRFMQDNNTISLSSLTLGYDFEKDLISKANLSMLRFEVGANNLMRFSTIKEERGTSYPFARTINFSIKASF